MTSIDMRSVDWANIGEALATCYEAYKYLKEREKKRREWVRPWLVCLHLVPKSNECEDAVFY